MPKVTQLDFLCLYLLYFINLVGMCFLVHLGLHYVKHYMCYLDLLLCHCLNELVYLMLGFHYESFVLIHYLVL